MLIFSMTTATIQVRGRGTLTLPASLREKYRLGEGDPLDGRRPGWSGPPQPQSARRATARCRDGAPPSSAKAVPEGFGWPGPRRLNRYSFVSMLTS